MQVTDEMVDKIAQLARLHFSPEEKAEIRQDLQQMIGFVDQLKSMDLGEVPPQIHMSDTANVWREDIIRGAVSSEQALQSAPAKSEPFFIVPKVIQK